jgi:hypothetical protein
VPRSEQCDMYAYPLNRQVPSSCVSRILRIIRIPSLAIHRKLATLNRESCADHRVSRHAMRLESCANHQTSLAVLSESCEPCESLEFLAWRFIRCLLWRTLRAPRITALLASTRAWEPLRIIGLWGMLRIIGVLGVGGSKDPHHYSTSVELKDHYTGRESFANHRTHAC